MLTWEAKKEAIFEMPVRPRRRVSRARFSRHARDVDAARVSRARDSMVMTRTRDEKTKTNACVRHRVRAYRPVVPRSCARARTS